MHTSFQSELRTAFWDGGQLPVARLLPETMARTTPHAFQTGAARCNQRPMESHCLSQRGELNRVAGDLILVARFEDSMKPRGEPEGSRDTQALPEILSKPSVESVVPICPSELKGGRNGKSDMGIGNLFRFEGGGVSCNGVQQFE